MHIEILVEDKSGGILLDTLLPKILGEHGAPHTWKIHPYRGIGHIPKDLKEKIDPAKRVLLNRLPDLLRGYGKTPGINAVVVVLDVDKRDRKEFLTELKEVADESCPATKVMFRLAIEEMEAWYLGDKEALLRAYPSAKNDIIRKYEQDSVCGTWELLANAVRQGGSKNSGIADSGYLKYEWAKKIGPLMNIEANVSPSFCKLRDGLRRITQQV